MIDRRAVLRGAISGAAAALLGRRVNAASGRAGVPMFHEWAPVRGPHVLVASGASGNMVLVTGKGGAESVLVDTQTCPFGVQIRREGEELGKRVACVINTHHHAEITGANHAFVADARVLADARARPRISGQVNRYISQVKEFLLREDVTGKERAVEAVQRDWLALHRRMAKLRPEEFAPTEVIENERTELEVGGRRVVLLRMSSGTGAHTDNDVVVHLPDDNVVITGGLVSANMHATIDRAGGANSEGWIGALARVRKLCDAQTIVVPAEGVVGNLSMLSWQEEYLRVMREAVQKAVAAGRTRQEVRRLRPRVRLPQGAPTDRLGAALDSLYHELAPAAAPAPAAPGKGEGG